MQFPCISLSGIGHDTLDFLGIIPLFEACDAINAAWYLFEGDYANAALSMTATISVVGSLGTGAKWGIKAGAKANKIAETVKLGSKISTKGKGYAVSGGQTLEAVKNVYKYVVKAGETANWSDAVEYTKLGLKVAQMGDVGASIAKNGPALKAMSKGQDVVEAAPISNATKRVASESGTNTNRNNRLALGLSDYLDDFAINNNAHIWKDGVNDALFNSDMEILVNLDGIDNPMLAVQRAASNRGGATDWELLQIKLTPSAWDRITWFLNGEVVSNPFN